MEHGVKLNPRQERAVRTIIPAIERMIGDNPLVPSVEEIKEELERKGQDYDGSTWVVMENLEQVLACWPEKTHAAVAPIEDFLTGDWRAQVLKPSESISYPLRSGPAKFQKAM